MRDARKEKDNAPNDGQEPTAAEAAAEAATERAEAEATPTSSEEPGDLAAQYLDALQRERASFINFRRRAEQERSEIVQYASAGLIKKLLPVLDDFDRALAAIPDAERKGNRWLEGIELIDRKLHQIMEQEGVEKIESLGQPFDPNMMEAVAFDDQGGSGEDTVAEVYAEGYKLRDRVLRPAMVKVKRT